jgi:hypothetical protein
VDRRLVSVVLCGLALCWSGACGDTPNKAADAAAFPDAFDGATDGAPDAAEDAGPGRRFESIEVLEVEALDLLAGEQSYSYLSAALRDLDDDGYKDAVLTVTTYPENDPQPIVIVRGEGAITNAAEDFFPDGVLAVRHGPHIFFRDVDGVNGDDMLVSEAGLDHPPWSGDLIGIALRQADGTFTDVSGTVPDEAQGLRCYALAAGDFFDDGQVHILLPSQTAPDLTGLLAWSEGTWQFTQDWVDMALWWSPTNLYAASNMIARDLDGDGREDLYASGSWTEPNHRILYGSAAFPSGDDLVTLPDGPFGHTPWNDYDQPGVMMARGADVNRVVLADFDGDGETDIVSIAEDVRIYKPGAFEDTKHANYSDVHENGGTAYYGTALQVLRKVDDRTYEDISPAAPGNDLGMRYYSVLLADDLDLDGDLDLVGHYWSKYYDGSVEPKWGSTFFFNDGHAGFERVEATELFADVLAATPSAEVFGLGAFFPARVTEDSVEGFFTAPVDSNLAAPKLRVVRIHANGSF